MRARFSGSEPDESSSIGGGDWSLFLRAEARVTGGKYPSFPLPASEGVGDGEMTRGVWGIWYCLDEAMAERKQVVKYGSGGARMRPDILERVVA